MMLKLLILIINLSFIVLLAFIDVRFMSQLKGLVDQLKVISGREEALAQECYNLRYQIDVIAQMVRK